MKTFWAWGAAFAASCLAPAPAFGFAPPVYEAQRSGFERADRAPVRRGRALTKPKTEVARRSWRRFAAAYPMARWRAQWDTELEIPRQVFGKGISVPGASEDSSRAEAAARRLLFTHLALFAPGSEPSDFELVANHFDARSRLRSVGFAQRHRGYRVRGGQISVRIKNDRLFMVGSEAYPEVVISPGSLTSLLPAATARAATDWMTASEPETLTISKTSDPGQPFILPLVRPGGQIDYQLVQEVVVSIAHPVSRWSVYLDARSGEPVAREQTLMFFDGTLSLDVPDRFPSNGRRTVRAPAMDIVVGDVSTRTDDLGRFSWSAPVNASVTVRARGENVRLTNRAGPLVEGRFVASDGAQLVFGASIEELTDAQIAAYYATDFVVRYVGGIAPGNRFVRDEAVQTNVNLNNSCNAFSDGRTINFFRGDQRCQNTARLLDVVMHEYGHAVHAQSIIQGVGRFDSALSEGLADYLAATIANDPGMGRGFFRNNQALRHLDLPDDARWPEDRAGDPHTTGIIYGGALWDLRKALVAKLGMEAGVRKTDELWYEVLRRAVDIPSTYLEILAADDDDGDLSNGTPNFCEISAAFERHGLANGASATPGLGPVELDGLDVRLPIQPASVTCPGAQIASAVLVWRQRSDPSVSGRIPLQLESTAYGGRLPELSAGEVLQYRLEIVLQSGATTLLPRNPADPYYETYIGETQPIYCTDFERSPWDEGWTHALVSGQPEEGADDWQWGIPGSEPGSGDPAQAASGARVVGNDLGAGRFNGRYQADKTNVLISPVFDTTGYSAVRLQYRRWLTVEDGFFDVASIRADGTALWSNFNSGRNGDTHHEDKEWRFHDVDLSGAASDGRVQVRFQLESDRGLEFGGWTIDDLCIVGILQALEPICGNGVLEPNEACDDGNTIPGDGCEGDCSLTPEGQCGNGVLEPGEACDDGNATGGDGCEADCSESPSTNPETCPDGSSPPCPISPDPQVRLLHESEDGCGCRNSASDPAGVSLALFLALLVFAQRRFALPRRARG